MSKQSKDPTAEFQDMAKQSLQAWQQMWSQAVGQAPATAPMGTHQGFNSGQESMQRVLEGLKGYLGWMENISSASAAAPGGLPWNDALSQAFAGNASNPFSAAFADLPGMGSLDPQHWQQQFLKTMAPMQQAMDGAFSMPAFGLAREHQEQSQAMGRAWAEYMQQSAHYQTLVARVGRQAAEQLEDKLAAHEEPGQQIDSMRALYNLWVDAAEEAWAEIAMSDEYREVYAAMTNAQMRVRQLVQQQVADAGRQLGMPTREEVDSLGKRLQELRRDLAELRNAQRAAVDTGTGKKSPVARKKPAASKKTASSRKSASDSKAAAGKKSAGAKKASPAKKSARKKPATKR